MKISIDGVPAFIQPDQVNWEPPDIVSRDGNNAPIYSPFWSCRIILPKVTEVYHMEWFELADGQTHTLELPHPATGVLTSYTCYIDSVIGAFDVQRRNCPAMTGVDIQCSGITVTM